MELLLFGGALGMLILAEHMPRLRFQRSPFVRPFFVSDLFYLVTGAILLSLLMRAQAAPWAGLFGEDIPRALANAPFAVTVGIAIILHDLGGYGSHILLHRIDTLWRYAGDQSRRAPPTNWRPGCR